MLDPALPLTIKTTIQFSVEFVSFTNSITRAPNTQVYHEFGEGFAPFLIGNSNLIKQVQHCFDQRKQTLICRPNVHSPAGCPAQKSPLTFLRDRNTQPAHLF